MEIWKTIEGYPNYEVSNMGRVKSLKYDKEKILKGIKKRDGYLLIGLSKEGKVKFFSLHRIVAQAFLPNPNNLSEVNHIDEDKTNNKVDNLEWCDRKYNNNYGTRTERAIKSKSISILQFSKEGNFIQKWDSAKDVERELGFNQGNINKCCKGKLKLAYGFKWCYHYKSIWLKNHIPLIKQKKVA